MCERSRASTVLQANERLFRLLHWLSQGEQAHGGQLHQASALHGRQCTQGVQQEDNASHRQIDTKHQIQGMVFLCFLVLI